MDKVKKTLPSSITTAELMKVDYHFNYSNQELLKDWKLLKSTHKFKTGSQWKPGLKICQHFCRNFFDIETKSGKSFVKAWNDPDLMDKVRLWGLEKMSALYLSWIRRAVYMASGMHNPSFYRPHLARQIILSTKKPTGILFDPCAGWGGRMLGTVSAGWTYIGCEPNTETYNNLLKIIEFLDIGANVKLYNTTYENFDINSIGKVDVVLTSPPYFDIEVYSPNDISTQSYLKFSDYKTWMNEWYIPMIIKNLRILKEDGLSCYNVMDGRCEDIVEQTKKQHENFGLSLVDTLGIDSPFKNYKKKLNKLDLTYIFKNIEFEKYNRYDIKQKTTKNELFVFG